MDANDNPEDTSLIATWANNFIRNTSESFTRMQIKDYIRLVMIVCSYLLLRPYLMKLGAKIQEKQHAKDAEETVNPNDLRGNIEIPGVDDSDEEEEESKPGDWGKSARVRQRKFIRDTLEKEERKLQEEQEDESDKEIEEFLTG
ncbi:DUF1531-domain-containing protein [Polyplosphaeria fusca]|uniref:DUF1531-domain-containing protein n=1 Tax=Polyplosphaeria fusca TaxID=682080 RepID=A0A9P4R8Q9_9PLEO|nr:DUF1531-domain-containing protein [Polyplosphaeria fusca]